MRYVDALKIWNQTENNGKWCFPSKGTEAHKQILEIMKGKPIKEGPKKRIIKVKRTKKKQVGGFAEGFRGDFKSQYNWDDPRFAQDLKNYEKQQGDGMSVWDLPEFRNEFKKHTPADLRQMGYGMDDTERNLRIRSLLKNTYGKNALDNYDKQQGNGLILPGRQQRGRGGDFPLEFAVEFAQDPMKYVNKLGSFMDATSGTKQMAEQIEKNTGAKRLFKWPWEN